MDFQFTLHQGNVSAKCSMEHIALANWFNSEVRSNSSVFLTALSALENPSPQQEIRLIGREYSLFIQGDEVLVQANNLNVEQAEDIWEQDFHYYDAESVAMCGSDDFRRFLNAYFDLIR